MCISRLLLGEQGVGFVMLDRVTAFPATVGRPEVSVLARRRAVYAAAVGLTSLAVLWLAVIAVPPSSVGGIAFLLLFTVTLPWAVVGFWNALIGFLLMRFSADPAAAVNPMANSVVGDERITASTAILMCIRNESPDPVVRNLQPLMQGLAEAGLADRFHVYVLSDSSFPDVIEAEEALIGPFAEKWKDIIPVTYRRRAINTGYKAGNIRDFCERWGGKHDFMVTLDADSYMPAETVLHLVRIGQANPRLGILQTLVIGMPSVSAFARVFQFGMRLGMRSYTLGATWWQGDCGPYWGHNALIRLAPFIAHCELPKLPGTGPLSGWVLSHDQVEAALMRRAGYEVRVLASESGSWEENPPTLMEFSRRDLRWCQGNMQYWKLLTMPGLKPVSRFHLMFAIWMYLGSPAWMAMMGIGTVLLAISQSSATQYVPVKPGAGTALFAITLVMAFAPKIATMIDVCLEETKRRSFGGSIRFILNLLAETLFMLLLAPIVALTHTIFMIRLFVFRRGLAWNGQARQTHAVPWRLAFTKLWPQTLAGCTVLGVVALKSPQDLGFALMGTSGLILAAPFAVATASPLIGRLFARLGIARLPEENDHRDALMPLRLPAIELTRPAAGQAANR